MRSLTAAGRSFVARRATPAEIVDLRWRVLRGGLPRPEAVFPGDDLPTSLHYAAIEVAAAAAAAAAVAVAVAVPVIEAAPPGVAESSSAAPRVVSCATMHLEPWEDEPAYRLRGMATEDGYRGLGLGRALLGLAEDDVRRDTPVRLFWCNARTPALAFYQRQGWEVRSGVFDIPTAGPHVRMAKRLA